MSSSSVRASADLIEHQPNQRLGAADVGGRHHEIEGDRTFSGNEIDNPPVATRRHRGHDWIAIEPEKTHGGRKHARAFILGFVEQLSRCRRHHLMGSIAEMRRRHHGAQRGLDRSLGVGEKIGDAGQRLVAFGVKHMKDRANQE
jgi:hypothetical protein